MCFKGSFSSNVVHYLVLLLLRQSWTYIFFKLWKFYLYINSVCCEVDAVMMVWITAVKTLDNCRQHTEKLIILKGCLHELILCAKLLSLCLTNICVCSWTECCRRHGEEKPKLHMLSSCRLPRAQDRGSWVTCLRDVRRAVQGLMCSQRRRPCPGAGGTWLASWGSRQESGSTGSVREALAEPLVSLRWTLAACW